MPRLQLGFDIPGRDASNFKWVLGPLAATANNQAIVAAQWELQRIRLGFFFDSILLAQPGIFGWLD